MPDRMYNSVVSNLGHHSNVYFLDRHICHWGNFGHVAATIKGIQEIILRNIQCDYVILLTGQDYPIKTNQYIDLFFQKNMGTDFLEYFALPTSHSWPNGGMDRIENWHFWIFGLHFWSGHRFNFPLLTRLWSAFFPFFFIKRKFITGLQPFGGSSYWCLSKNTIEHIHSFLNQNPNYVKFFQNVFIPDEIFFQTIILNSSFKDKVVNDNLRYISWVNEKPAILEKNDFLHLKMSPQLFARKFDMTVDAEILDMIDEQLLPSGT